MTADVLRLTVLGDPDRVAELAGEPDPNASNGFPPEVRSLTPTAEERAAGQARYEVTIDGWVLEVRVEQAARAALLERARRGAAATRAHVREVGRARIPGRVVRLWVEPGQVVAAGERLLAVEAMKMENEVRAPRAGTVVSIAVAVGQPVELGSELVTLD
jgi:oxaloacetate decarboxylase alpha subunit